MSFAGKIYSVRPGTVMIFDSYERHDKDLGPHIPNYRHLWLHQSNRHGISANIFSVKEGQASDIRLKFLIGRQAELLEDVWNECRQHPGSALHWTFLKSVLTSIFLEVASDWKPIEIVTPHQQIIDSVCEYIHHHLGEDLTLARLAQHAGYSPFFFHRLFIRYRKQTLHHYVIAARMERAKEMLKSGHTLEAISEEIGMPSPAYFSRFFKKQTRFNASHWRELHQSK